MPAQRGESDDPRASNDKPEPEGGEDGLTPTVRRAYWAYITAEKALGGDCTDKEAYDYITGDDPKGSFTHYTPRSLVTWTRQVRIGRNHHGTQKNKPRGGRSGRSTVSARDRDMPRNDA